MSAGECEGLRLNEGIDSSHGPIAKPISRGDEGWFQIQNDMISSISALISFSCIAKSRLGKMASEIVSMFVQN